MLDYKTKKELLFLLEEDNFHLLENEIINTKGAIIYYFSLYDLEKEFFEKKYSNQIQEILNFKMIMNENIPDKYENLLKLGMLKDQSNNVLDYMYINSNTRFSMNYNKSNLMENLEHWENFKKIIDKKINLKIDVMFVENFISSYEEALTLKDKNDNARKLVEIFNDIKLDVLKSLNEEDLTCLSIKNIGLNYWENNYPVTKNDYLVFNLLFTVMRERDFSVKSFIDNNYSHLLNPESLNLWLNNSKKYKQNIKKVKEVEKKLQNDPKFWESEDNDFVLNYIKVLIDDKKIDDIKNLLNNNDVAHYVIYGLWLVEEKGEKYRKLVDELLKDIPPEKILESLFDKIKLKVKDHQFSNFINNILNGSSKVWKNVFLNDVFLKYVSYENNYNSGNVTVIKKEISEDVENYFSDYLLRRVETKKITLNDVLIASTVLIHDNSTIIVNESSKVSFDILKALKKAQDEIFGDAMDYVNFIHSDIALKNIREHIKLLSDEQKKELEGLYCFREDYDLWDKKKSKIDFFKTFHDMYIIGGLNNIKNIPDYKLSQLNNLTLEMPSVYLASCVQNNHRMFVNEVREKDIVKAWLKNAFESNREDVTTSLFNKFISAINLLRTTENKNNFINSVHNALSELPGYEKLYKNHNFFKIEEHNEYVKKIYDKGIKRLGYIKNLPSFILKDLWINVLSFGSKEDIDNFAINTFKYQDNAGVVVDYLKENKELIKKLVTEELTEGNKNMNFSSLRENLLAFGIVNIKEDRSLLDVCKDLEGLSFFEGISDKKLKDMDLTFKLLENILNKTRERIYNLIDKKTDNVVYDKDEIKLIDEIKVINETYPQLLVYIIPEVSVNDIARPNLQFMKDMPAMYVCFMHMNEKQLDISKFSPEDKKNVYKLLESSEDFNSNMHNIYKGVKDKQNMPLAFSLFFSYLEDNEDLSRLKTKGLFSYIKKLQEDFKNFIDEKKMSTKEILKISSFLMEDRSFFNVLNNILSSHVSNNLDTLEDNEILSLMDFNNSYIAKRKFENLLRNPGNKGLDNNIFDIEILEPAFEKIVMKKELKANKSVKKSVKKF